MNQEVERKVMIVAKNGLGDVGSTLGLYSIEKAVRGNLRFLRAQRYFAGSVYFGLGAATALTGTTRK